MPGRVLLIVSCLVLGLVVRGTARGADQPASHSKVRVAVYDDTGASRNLPNLLAALAEHPDLHFDRLDAEAIRSGALAGYDVLIQPGGTGSRQGKTLGEEGREQIRTFVAKGGGYLGICAGAYLATCDYPWSLHILDARVVDKAHWARGTGPVDVAITPRGHAVLGVKEERPAILYYQGPLLAPAGDPQLPDYEVLGAFAGEIAKKGAPHGVMPGTTAIAAAPFKKGRVLCISPHPERTDNLHDMIYRAVLWVTRR
jgi:glutamine amidotransferase PdxT